MSKAFLGQSLQFGPTAYLELPAAGLRVRDTDASHVLTLSLLSNLTANRTLSVTTGDADRALTLAGDATISGVNTGDQDLSGYVPTSRAVNGHALTADVTVTASDVGLGSVTNDAQTKASIVPNTAPSAGQVLAGNAGGTAYAPVTVSGSGCTASLSSAGVLTLSGIANSALSNSSVTVTAGTGLSGGGAVSLGGTVTVNLASDIPQAETITVSDSGTSTVPTVLAVRHNNNAAGTPGAGFGGTLEFDAQSTTTANRPVASIVYGWQTAADATRTGQMDFYAYRGSTAVWCMSVCAVGAAAQVGFLGATAASRQIGDAGTALVTFGLMSGTPTFAAANLTGSSLPSGITGSSLTSTGTLTGGATGSGFTIALGTSTITGILGSANGGTGNGFAKFSGPASSEKTFTLPNATCTVLTDNALVTAAQGGTSNGFFAVSGPASSTKTYTFPNSNSTVVCYGTAGTFSAAQTFPNSSGVKIQDTDASNALGIVGGSNLTADRTLTVTTGDASRTLTLSGDLTVGGASSINGTAVVTTRTLGTTAPLTGGGDLSADRTLAVSDFVAAGASHARGTVPDPGSTSHSHHPYYLGDDGAWHLPSGYVLGKAQVLTSQSTTSATAVGLTTALSFSITIDVTCDLIVYCSCNCISGTTDQTGRVYAENNTSGSTVADLVSLNTVNPATGGASLSGKRLYSSVPAGTYTFTQKYSITGGATGSFSERFMEVTVA